MSDRIDPPLLPGDVTVSADLEGYMIGANADRGFSVVAAGLTWPLAIHRAHVYSLTRGGRVLVSRAGDPFEVLDVKDAWLAADRTWRAHDRAIVARHAPAAGGVYVLRATTPVYVGETTNLRERLLYHLDHPSECAQRFGALEFSVQEFISTDLRSRRAARLTAWWMPPCNEIG